MTRSFGDLITGHRRRRAWAPRASTRLTRHSRAVAAAPASGPVVGAEDALDLDDAAHLVELADQRLELSQVVRHEREDVAGQAVLTGATVGLADIDVLGAEGLGHVREDA